MISQQDDDRQRAARTGGVREGVRAAGLEMHHETARQLAENPAQRKELSFSASKFSLAAECARTDTAARTPAAPPPTAHTFTPRTSFRDIRKEGWLSTQTRLNGQAQQDFASKSMPYMVALKQSVRLVLQLRSRSVWTQQHPTKRAQRNK